MTPKPQLIEPSLSQKDLQIELERVHEAQGLEKVLDTVYHLSFGTGYLKPELLEVNDRLSFFDCQDEIYYRVQVNRARSGYSPKPVQTDSNLPPVKCNICIENVGRPGKETMRIYEFQLNGRPYFLQPTPFPLYPCHFVLVLKQHSPMCISRLSLEEGFAFLAKAPNYTVCSNSDVEWAGASILEHLHFQIFKGLSLPVMECSYQFTFDNLPQGVTGGILKYPLTSIRLNSDSKEALIEVGYTIIKYWKSTDPGKATVNFVLWQDSLKKHHLVIFLRHPDHRTPESWLKIKTEGVGIIEAAGEGIFPVPSTARPDEKELWREIRENGKTIIKDILAGLNPVEDRGKLMESLENELSNMRR
ncbi:hypothetical protein K493DRAFT_313751 [Basidiobolus meristosporus CBS 931.73]|uniref:DUF4922 domain-containing protein n=1 Tax=Basidiobolus meristosporus CBS 931.73 TaxID=1314790 RepID=A0A1Y1YJK9_9FUNG|nr:hypothetical protein K493DRAFT_313751 [Basidiobolus meristosporus CBS 931.73]|eukprot:ORX98207.1 hypothetical protein K493DRAFT_313751 [Basidiobolus meristosporus CBS 931.73]